MSTVKILSAAFAAMLLAGCGHTTLPTTRPASVPTVAKVAKPDANVAKPDTKASKYLRINYVTGNGMFGDSFVIRQGEMLWLRASVMSSDPMSRVQFNWNGIGVFGTGDSATFNYPFPGNYMINLEVRDERGNRDWRMLNVWVQARGTAEATKQEPKVPEVDAPTPQAPAAE